LGISRDDTEIPEWRAQLHLAPRQPAVVAIELKVNDTMTEAKAIEPNPQTESQAPEVTPMWTQKRQQQRTVHNRFLGCLLGGAVGDALGAPVEFMSRTEILRRFGSRGITSYAPAFGGIGNITDDTQMTLFTAEGLIRSWVRGVLKGVTSYSSVTAHAYLRWLRTQGEHNSHNIEHGQDEPGWLFQQKALHSRRAPGNTCLSALHQISSLGTPARNNSKGCGGVMRVAPVGLFAWQMQKKSTAEEATFELGTELAAITHGHPTGSLTGGVLAVLVLALTDGAALTEALTAAKMILRKEADHEETLQALELAESLAKSDVPHYEAIAQLGQGWIAEEALAISVYCALVARNFKEGVIMAVNHDGDSDSTGAITGNLLGAMHGVKVIPKQWLEQLELRDVITELANDLFEFPNWGLYTHYEDQELVDKIWQKYPGF
jgi:ADP-ribosylglycohydrolase